VAGTFAGSAATLVDAFIAVIPAAALFFGAYGRYDGMFRDNVVFLYFIGGLLVGGLLGFVTILALGINAPLVTVLLIALFWPVSITLGINRRKWQGERHAVFNGGALGLGAAVMVSLSVLYRLVVGLRTEAATAQPDDVVGYVNAHVFTLGNLAQSLLLAAAFAGVFFGLGLLAGDSVRRRKPIATALLGAAIVLPVAIFLFEFVIDRAWLWVALLLVYGGAVAFFAERKLFLEGVTEDDRKALRRRKRRAAQE
jgi:hypothetical protein